MEEFFSDLFKFVLAVGVFALVCYIGYKILDKRSIEYEKKNNTLEKSRNYWREKRWAEQAEKDKRFLELNPSVKQKMEDSYFKLLTIWRAQFDVLNFSRREIDDGSNIQLTKKDKENISKIALTGLTPSLFLKYYKSFMSKDKSDIKEAIYTERPYFSLELYIEMVLFIFENEMNLYLLNYIIKSKDKNITQDDKNKAIELLEQSKDV